MYAGYGSSHEKGQAAIEMTEFTEKLLVGPLFHLIGAKKESANILFDAFGRAFESYTTALLAAMFSNHRPNPFLPSPRGHDTGGQPVEISDAMLTYGRTVFLFEFKAVWIQDQTLLQEDSSIYLDHLLAKYSKDPKTGTVKGVAQIANSITRSPPEIGFRRRQKCVRTRFSIQSYSCTII